MSLSVSDAAQARDSRENPWTLCARHSAQIEMDKGLPPHLLSAISKVESGRWAKSKGAVFAWPWTVTSGGKGRYFPTMSAAINKVRALRAQGRRNIDVGCMQVNLLYHPDAFEDLTAAFDPARNVAYAADLLRRLRKETRSWPKAIAYYHSRTPSLNGPYRNKVLRAWHKERQRASLTSKPVPPVQRVSLARVSLKGPNGGVTKLGEVQLGAFRKPENAVSVLQGLLRDHGEHLRGLEPRIEVAKRRDSGVIHFLRIGPVMNARLARSICNDLRARAVDCLIVDPPRAIVLSRVIEPFR